VCGASAVSHLLCLIPALARPCWARAPAVFRGAASARARPVGSHFHGFKKTSKAPPRRNYACGAGAVLPFASGIQSLVSWLCRQDGLSLARRLRCGCCIVSAFNKLSEPHAGDRGRWALIFTVLKNPPKAPPRLNSQQRCPALKGTCRRASAAVTQGHSVAAGARRTSHAVRTPNPRMPRIARRRLDRPAAKPVQSAPAINAAETCPDQADLQATGFIVLDHTGRYPA
jgi:hypothetical protein